MLPRFFRQSLVKTAPGLISPLWLVPGCMLVAWGWLLPNTTIPWIAFHRDAWVSGAMSLAAIVAMVRVREPTPWHWLALVSAAIATVPLLQWAFGLLPFAGIAWLSTGYVLAFLLAMLTGALWAGRNPVEPGNALFLAIGLGATLSAGIGMYQWFGLKFLGIWVLDPYIEHRAYANLGQPNQLATLLVWGVAACGWALVRGFIRLPVAALWWAFLLTGITLTQSRTAWVALAVFLALGWHWRRLFPIPGLRRTMAALALYFLLLNLMLAPITHALGLDPPVGLLGKIANESRPAIWAMFLDATTVRPWFGFGWTQVTLAQMSVSPFHPEMVGRTFSHAHNLFIDLVLFMGWPLGLAAGGTLLAWLWGQLRRVSTPEDALLLLPVIALGLHAMVELPHHYAYLLVPAGLAMGVLNARNAPPARVRTSRWVFAALCSATLALFCIIVVDYLEVEDNYTAMRFEGARIGTLPPREAPQVLVLTQMREMLRLGRFTVHAGMTPAELQWMRDVTEFHSSLTNLHSLAVALGLNGRTAEAQVLVTNVCDTITPQQCVIFKNAWKRSQKDYPVLQAVSPPP